MFLEVTNNLMASEILRSMVRNHSLKKNMVYVYRRRLTQKSAETDHRPGFLFVWTFSLKPLRSAYMSMS